MLCIKFALIFEIIIYAQSSLLISCPPSLKDVKLTSIPWTPIELKEMVKLYHGPKDLADQSIAMFGRSGDFSLGYVFYSVACSSLILPITCTMKGEADSFIDASIATVLCVNYKTKAAHFFHLPINAELKNTRVFGAFQCSPTIFGIVIQLKSAAPSLGSDRYVLAIWNIEKQTVERVINWLPIAEPLSGIDFRAWCVDLAKSKIGMSELRGSMDHKLTPNLIMRSAQTKEAINISPPIHIVNSNYRIIPCKSQEKFIECKHDPIFSMTCFDSRSIDGLKWKIVSDDLRRVFETVSGEAWLIGCSSLPSGYSLLAAMKGAHGSLIFLVRNDDGSIVSTWDGDDDWCCLNRNCLVSQDGKICYLWKSDQVGHLSICEFDVENKVYGRILASENFYPLELDTISPSGNIIGTGKNIVFEFDGVGSGKELFRLNPDDSEF